MKNKVIETIVLLLFMVASASAQKAERDYIRKGNRFYNDSVYVKAEVNYRKSLDVNSKSVISMYNLGNTLLLQDKTKEAMEEYAAAAKLEKDKSKLAHIHHNMGVVLQSGKNYAKAIAEYKQSLRNNPKDDETRYNLALAQKLLKEQQQQNKNKQNQKQQDQEKNKQNQKDKNTDKQQNKQQNQPSQSQKQKNQMSKENAEQLLNSVMQDEKDIQDKVKKQQVIQGGRLKKDW
ncbi:MAG: aerotolerance regulator BatC [Bacteroides sp.]|jgi:tetratricopeptide (TPR) repeat protein|nr:aerotolerance regulator BatC [Bacteroides sp.]